MADYRNDVFIAGPYRHVAKHFVAALNAELESGEVMVRLIKTGRNTFTAAVRDDAIVADLADSGLSSRAIAFLATRQMAFTLTATGSQATRVTVVVSTPATFEELFDTSLEAMGETPIEWAAEVAASVANWASRMSDIVSRMVAEIDGPQRGVE